MQHDVFVKLAGRQAGRQAGAQVDAPAGRHACTQGHRTGHPSESRAVLRDGSVSNLWTVNETDGVTEAAAVARAACTSPARVVHSFVCKRQPDHPHALQLLHPLCIENSQCTQEQETYRLLGADNERGREGGRGKKKRRNKENFKFPSLCQVNSGREVACLQRSRWATYQV